MDLQDSATGSNFLRGGARSPKRYVVLFANANEDNVVEGKKLGVKLICRLLQVAPCTYSAVWDRVPSARALNYAVLFPQLFALSEDNFSVSGVRKLWRAARWAGIDIGRDQTARLMKNFGMRGALQSKRVKIIIPEPTAVRHPALVKGQFSALAPNQQWVMDLTLVPT